MHQATLLLMIALLAVARPTRADNAAEARALFDSAKASAKAGDCATAVPKFAKAYQLDPKPGTLRNLGYCEEQLGRLASAWRHFREVTEKFPASDHVEYAKQRGAALEPRVPKLTIKLADGGPERTTVKLDGEEIAPDDLETALSIDPGEHEIEVSAPGHATRRYTVILAERDSEEREVRLGSRAQTGPLQNSRRIPSSDATGGEGHGSGTRTAGYIVGGVGLAGLAVGVVALSVAYAHCGFWRTDCEQDEREEAKRWQKPAIGALVGGGVLAAIGAVLVLTARPDTSGLRVTPTFAVGRAACVLEGSW